MSRSMIFDNWTPLSFKAAMQSGTATSSKPWVAPTWVGDHARRLLAYKILKSYDDNAAREFRPETENRDREDHREYGDAALLIDAITSALLGESQTITVPGAENYDPEPEEGQEVDPDARVAWELQEWLRSWADDERLPIKMIENERNAVTLGDGVYTLGWSSAKGRPRLRVFDPGFYFPVLDDGNDDDFPTTVHIAWELENDDLESEKRQVRRITWRLAPIAPAGEAVDGSSALRDGEALDENGQITRRLPWNDEPTTVTCYLTDAVWDWDPMERRAVNDFDEGAASYNVNDEGVELRDLDLQIDFIPVVHVPNTVNVLEHYGRSSLLKVLQILDDLANADTDLQAASATTGTPPVGLSGAHLQSGDKLTYRPGEILEMGDQGRLDIVDTSKSLDALLKYLDELLSRLSTNARTPSAVLGRTEPSEVPSGIALALSFGPLRSMIDQMRLVREEKYPLVLKFAQRLAVSGRQEDAPEDFRLPSVEFGSFLPEDRAAAVREVTELLNAEAISPETGVRTLQQAGFPIEDAVEEVRLIQSRQFEKADKLLDATGDQDAVRKFLGMEPEQSRPPPPPGV